MPDLAKVDSSEEEGKECGGEKDRQPDLEGPGSQDPRHFDSRVSRPERGVGFTVDSATKPGELGIFRIDFAEKNEAKF